MENTVIQRVELFCKKNNLSIRKFSQLINYPYTTINNYTSGQRKAIDVNLIIKTLSTFEEISPDWLLLGKGDMLRSNPEEAKYPPDNREVITLLLERIEKLSGEVALLKKELEKKEEK